MDKIFTESQVEQYLDIMLNNKFNSMPLHPSFRLFDRNTNYSPLTIMYKNNVVYSGPFDDSLRIVMYIKNPILQV